MNRLPSVTGAELVRALQRAGFSVVRQRRSHIFLKHDDGRTTVVPVHCGERLGPGMVLKVARDLELTREEIIDMLRP